MKKFTKTIVKEFKTGFGRFLAIMAIVALGVGFLIGIMQATPDMRNTMSDYYIENAAMTNRYTYRRPHRRRRVGRFLDGGGR